MPYIPRPDDLYSIIQGLENRISILENTNPLQHGAVGPDGYFAQFDSNNVPRIEMGNLSLRGLSQAQIGVRVNNANAVPIWDSLGLIGPLSILGSTLNFSSQSNTGNGSFQTVSGSSVSVNLPRQEGLLVLAAGQLLDPTVGDTAYLLSSGILLDGSFSANNGPQVYWTGAGAVGVNPFAVLVATAAGSHTLAFGVQQTNGKLWSVTNGYLYVFQLGG